MVTSATYDHHVPTRRARDGRRRSDDAAAGCEKSTLECAGVASSISIGDLRGIAPRNDRKDGNDGTTERRNDGTTGNEETQTAADTSGTAAETAEEQSAPNIWRGIRSF